MGKEKILKLLLLVTAVVYPFFASAVTLGVVVERSQEALNVVIPLFLTAGVAVFIWGVMMYIASAGDVEKEKKARGRIIFGLVGLFVLVAFWGLVTVIANTLDIHEGNAPFQTHFEFYF